MISEFKGGIAAVTGGASGLGRATAAALSAQGFSVVIIDLDETTGQSAAKEIGAVFLQTDVSNPDDVKQTMAETAKQGTLRVLVNCAGIASAAKTVSRGEAHDATLFTRVININLIGSFHCASQAAALMSHAPTVNDDGARGVIINTASVAAFDGQVGQLAYAASKGGIVSMTLPMARDLADKGVRVCAIAPGLFLTPLLSALPEDVQTSLGNQVPFPARLGDPAEFGQMVVSIVDNPMLNGEVIRLDGAIRMAPR